MPAIHGLAVIPDKLEEVRASDFPLSTDLPNFGVQVVVERTRLNLSAYEAQVSERLGKTCIVAKVTVTLSLEDAKRLWDGLPAAIEWAEKKNKQSDPKVGQET